MLVNTRTAFAAKTLDWIVDRGFASNFALGTLANPIEPDNFNTILFMGNTIAPCYFMANVAGAGAIARLIVNTASQKDDLVVVQNKVTQIDILSGKAAISGAATVSGRVKVAGSSGGSLAQLTVPSGCTLTGCEFYVKSGKLDISTTMETCAVDGGELVLSGSAGVSTRLEMGGGITYWDATSAIALGEIMGGSLKTRSDRKGRTLTNCNLYADGDVDFSIGGLSITVSNPIRCFGSNRPKFPIGAAYSAVV
jgi:hypothetical protein